MPHDFVRVLEAWRGHWRLFVLLVALVLLAAAGWIHLSVPQYTAKATILLDARKHVVTPTPNVLADIDTDAPMIDTQVELIRSRVILGRAADLLAAAGTFGHPADAGTPNHPRIDTLASGLDVQRMGLSLALELSFTADQPSFAASAVNSIAAAYIDYQMQLKQQATRDATRWLNERVTASQLHLRDADAAVDEFTSRSGLLTAKGATSAETWAANQEAGFDAAQRSLSNARARLFMIEQALQTQGAAAAAKLMDTPSMLELRERYTKLANLKAQLSATAGPHHPRSIELSQQLSALQAQIETEAHRTIEELRSGVAIGERSVARLQESRALARARLAQDSTAQVKLADMKARADPMRRLHEHMLDRLQETSVQASLSRINATVASAAAIPLQPTSPNVRLILAIAVAAGLAIGSLSVFVVDVFSTTLSRPEEIERKTRLPIVGMIPEIRRAERRVAGTRVALSELVPAKPSARFAESFRRLRETMLGSFEPCTSVVVQFTSSTFSQGTTTSAIAFAQAAAADGRRVLVIDADARRASLTRALDISVETGLLEVLNGTAELDDAIVPTNGLRMPYVLPLSKHALPSHDRFSSRAFEVLLERLRYEFDFVVIDSPPVLAVADSLALSSRVDAVVLAARWNRTPIDLLMRAVEVIRRANGRITGIMLTRVAMKLPEAEPCSTDSMSHLGGAAVRMH